MKKLLPLYIVIFFAFFGYSIQIPLFTAMILNPNDPLGGTPATVGSYLPFLVGILLSMYPLGQFFGSPILGALSDRFGRRRVLLLSLGLCSLAYLLTTIVVSFRSYGFLLLSLFLAGIAEGNIAIAQGSIVDVTEDQNRSQYFGYIYVCSGLGFVFGPIFSGFLSDPSIVWWFGPEVVYILITVVMALVLTYVYFSFEETLLEKNHSRRSYFDQILNLVDVFKDRSIRFYYGVNFILYFAIFGFFRVYATYIVELYDVTLFVLSLIVAYVAVPMIVTNTIISPILSKLEKPKLITIFSSFGMGLFMLSITAFPQFHSIWGTLYLTATGIALTMTFSASMISFLAPKDHQGSVMGNNQSIVAGAQGLSALAGGFLASLFIQLPLLVFGAMGILGSLLLLKRYQNRHNHPTPH